MDQQGQINYILGLLLFPLALTITSTAEYIVGEESLFQFTLTVGAAMLWIVAYLTGSILVRKIKS